MTSFQQSIALVQAVAALSSEPTAATNPSFRDQANLKALAIEQSVRDSPQSAAQKLVLAALPLNPRIIQSKVTGDCDVLALLMAAYSSDKGRETLSSMITEKGSGKNLVYTVRLPGQEPIVVTQKDANEKFLSKAPLEVRILEVAIGKAKLEMIPPEIRFGIKTWRDALEHGGFAGNTMRTLCGSNVSKIAPGFTPDSMKLEYLKETLQHLASSNGRLIATTGFIPIEQALAKGIKFDKIDLKNGVGLLQTSQLEYTEGHAYAITKVDLEKSTITLSNPWDSSQQFEVSLADFSQCTSGIEIGSLSPELKVTGLIPNVIQWLNQKGVIVLRDPSSGQETFVKDGQKIK